jgi:hypothetical protein
LGTPFFSHPVAPVHPVKNTDRINRKRQEIISRLNYLVAPIHPAKIENGLAGWTGKKGIPSD